MQIRPFVSIAAVCCASCALQFGCGNGTYKFSGDPSTSETRAHLAEQTKNEELRMRMRGIAQEVAIRLPIACDVSLLTVSDFVTTSDLLMLAADGGMFAYSRCASPDPHRGLADLIVTFSTLRTYYESYSQDKGFEGLLSVVEVLQTAATEFSKLGDECLPSEVRALIASDIAAATGKGEAMVHGHSRTAGLMSAKVNVPAGLQISSSFLSFNDNGMLENALGEAHYMRLSMQRTADCMSLLPLSAGYHARRAALWTMVQPQMQALQGKFSDATADLKSLDGLKALEKLQALEKLESLRGLEPLSQLDGLPWKLGTAMVIALAAQGALLALVLRRR